MERSVSPTDWIRLRRPREPAVDARLSAGILCIELHGERIDERATRLFASLPYGCRLHATRSRFPHVANRLAARWNDADGFRNAMDDLLVDRRGGRQGFPPETVFELLALRTWHEERVEPRLRRAAGLVPALAASSAC